MGSSLIGFITLIALAIATHFSPGGWKRLSELGFWLTVAGALLPPILFLLYSYNKSENPALFFVLVLMTIFAAAAGGYLVGLFIPPRWPLYVNVSLGLFFWSLVLVWNLYRQ